ncbi:hypothetical protein APHAL10511_000815 [Amanita phalloides]|nr:hypothetical protein APHAL10511_000815 [Amanita phalloides]
MVWNTLPLDSISPVLRQPLHRCLDQSVHSCCHSASHFRPLTRDDDEDSRRTADGQRQLLGLGFTLPRSVSLRSSKDLPTSSDDSDITLMRGLQANTSAFAKSPETLHEVLLTPVLHPLDLQDEISPILPLPSPVDADNRTAEVVSSPASLAELICETLPLYKNSRGSNRRLSTLGYVRMQVCASGSTITDDITSKLLGDEIYVAEHTKLLPSPVEGTPTIDIADEGLLLIRKAFGSSTAQFGSGCDNCENGHVFSQDSGIVENPVSDRKHASLTLWNTTSTTHPSSIRIYYGEPQSHGLGVRLSPNAALADLRRPRTNVRFRSNIVMRDSAVRRNGLGKKPIEVSSPSMTPSPTSSPKFCIPPLQPKEEGKSRAEILARRPPWTQNFSNSKTGRWRPSIVCSQTVKGRSSRLSRHEVAIVSTRQGAWSSPKLRSPIVSSHSVGVTSPITDARGDIGDTAVTRAALSQLFLPSANTKDMLQMA